MATYRVRQGDSVASLGKQFGVTAKSIWEHPENEELRKRRDDPNVLYPGDQLFIPNRVEGESDAATGRRHRFRSAGERAILHLRLQDSKGQPLQNRRYRLVVEGDGLFGRTDAVGELVARIDPCAQAGEITVWQTEELDDEGWSWRLQIGHLDPTNEVTGIQSRLNQLGYNCGDVDGVLGPQTLAALEEFRAARQLQVGGAPDAETCRHLWEAHDKV